MFDDVDSLSTHFIAHKVYKLLNLFRFVFQLGIMSYNIHTCSSRMIVIQDKDHILHSSSDFSGNLFSFFIKGDGETVLLKRKKNNNNK